MKEFFRGPMPFLCIGHSFDHMLILLFAVHWQWLPASGMVDAVMHDYMSPGEQLSDRIKHLILPGLGLGVGLDNAQWDTL